MANKISLGIRLNNPANIRYNSLNHWFGQVGQSKGFCKFRDVECGVRALIVLIRNYRYKYDLKTVRDIVTRFAPPSENNTESYINFVVDYLHKHGFDVSSDDELFLDFYFPFYTLLTCLVSAICKQETGYELSFETFKSALHLCHFT